MSFAERYTQIHDAIWRVWNNYSGRIRETVKPRWNIFYGKVSSAVKQTKMHFDSVWAACRNQTRIAQDKMDRLGRHSPSGYAAVAAIKIVAMLFVIILAVECVYHFRSCFWMLFRYLTYLVYLAVIIVIRATSMIFVYAGPILKYVVISISKIFMGLIVYAFCFLKYTALLALNGVATVSYYLITPFSSSAIDLRNDWKSILQLCFLCGAVTLVLLWRLRVTDPTDSSEGTNLITSEKINECVFC